LRSEFDNINKGANPNNPYSYNYYENPGNVSQNDSFFKTNVNVNVNVTPNSNLLKQVESTTKKTHIPQKTTTSKIQTTNIPASKSMTMKKK
jgi:hypothetical protein